jgi:hypothetical protein
MPREGMLSVRKSHYASMKSSDPGSLTSRRRKNRGFKSLETSCRIHKRAARRSLNSRTQFGKLGVPGEKVTESGGFTHTCGGSIKYY